MAALAGFFGGLAMAVASVGLYGIVSYMVVRRKNEIGVRMAMGATPRDIVALVLSQSGRLVVIGCAVGSGLALAAGGFVRALMFGIEPRSIDTVGIACALLVIVAARPVSRQRFGPRVPNPMRPCGPTEWRLPKLNDRLGSQ